MMKQIYLIGGSMGVGKTTTCLELKKLLHKSVFLDGDWCWDMNPFIVSEETKKMVMDNICYLLNNFIKCTEYEHIIFCWVMHEQEIINEILSNLNLINCNVHKISLVCSESSLQKRLKKDILNGIRGEDIIERSLERLSLYEILNTEKLDVSSLTPKEVAYKIKFL